MSLSLVSTTTDELDDIVDIELYDSSSDCIKILRLDGTIERLSPGGQVALELDSIDQLNGSNWPSLWPGSEQVQVAEAVLAGRNGKRTQFLAFCPTAKMTPRWWDVVVTPIPGGTASTHGLLVVSRDVTELVHAKEALVRINEQKDEFLTILSHELRNPLLALSMAATVIAKAYGHVPQMANLSDLIHRQVGHMSRLTEDLLDVSRITRGQVNLQKTVFDLRDIVLDVTEQLAYMLTVKGQTLRKSIPDSPVLIDGDRMRLTQVLGNLIANASRYSPSNSAIDVCIAWDADMATVAVSDVGQGIPAEIIPNLFDLYYQGQTNLDGKASGIGLGLAIVKGLVELHNGTVRGESAGVGMGSTFTVKLPTKTLTDQCEKGG
jgi:signal transduction histidine kinase